MLDLPLFEQIITFLGGAFVGLLIGVLIGAQMGYKSREALVQDEEHVQFHTTGNPDLP